MRKSKGIAKACQEAELSEGAMRRLERKGVVHPERDPWGRRLFGDDDVAAARAYVSRISTPKRVAAA